MANNAIFEIKTEDGQVLSQHYDVISALQALNNNEPIINSALYRRSDQVILAMRCKYEQWYVMRKKVQEYNQDLREEDNKEYFDIARA